MWRISVRPTGPGRPSDTPLREPGCTMDSVTSPATAIAMGKMGALGVLDLEGLWTR